MKCYLFDKNFNEVCAEVEVDFYTWEVKNNFSKALGAEISSIQNVNATIPSDKVDIYDLINSLNNPYAKPGYIVASGISRKKRRKLGIKNKYLMYSLRILHVQVAPGNFICQFGCLEEVDATTKLILLNKIKKGSKDG